MSMVGRCVVMYVMCAYISVQHPGVRNKVIPAKDGDVTDRMWKVRLYACTFVAPLKVERFYHTSLKQPEILANVLSRVQKMLARFLVLFK